MIIPEHTKIINIYVYTCIILTCSLNCTDGCHSQAVRFCTAPIAASNVSVFEQSERRGRYISTSSGCHSCSPIRRPTRVRLSTQTNQHQFRCGTVCPFFSIFHLLFNYIRKYVFSVVRNRWVPMVMVTLVCC